jgi:hypothetical protein
LAIRIREVEGARVAINAAKSVEKEGDIYLDDGVHEVLSRKFGRDFKAMYGFDLIDGDETELRLVEQEESNNPNRTWWDETYGETV